MPIAMPCAPQASDAASPVPSRRPPAASTSTPEPSRVRTTAGTSSDVGTNPVWPPPSAPWAITALTPMPATFSAWRGAPTVTTVATPASSNRAT